MFLSAHTKLITEVCGICVEFASCLSLKAFTFTFGTCLALHTLTLTLTTLAFTLMFSPFTYTFAFHALSFPFAVAQPFPQLRSLDSVFLGISPASLQVVLEEFIHGTQVFAADARAPPPTTARRSSWAAGRPRVAATSS